MSKANSSRSARKKTAFRVKLVIFTLALTAYGMSVYFFRTDIDRFLNLAQYGAAGMSAVKDPEGGSVESGSFNKGALKVHFVDVGQGDATVIELPDNKTMIIDGGKAGEKDKFLTYMESSLPEAGGFDYAVLTHSDEDHCGGFPGILSKYPMKKDGVIYRPNQVSNYKDFTDPALSKTGAEGFWGNYTEFGAGKNTAAYKKFIAAAYGQDSGKNVKVLVTDARTEAGGETNKVPFKTAAGADVTKEDGGGKLLRNSKMDIFGDADNSGTYDPMTDYLITFYAPSKAAWKDVNDYSPVISLDYQNKRFMFTGDSEAEGEKAFAEDYRAGKFSFDKKADVIKLGHHGSRTSTGDAYLKAVLSSETSNPNALAVISCGEGNSYGHPHNETLTRLKDNYGFKDENILRTDKEGAVALSVSAGKVLYGTVEIKQSDGFEPLSWITIGGGIVIVLFILMFCIRVSNKGKVTVKSPAAARTGSLPQANIAAKTSAAPAANTAPKTETAPQTIAAVKTSAAAVNIAVMPDAPKTSTAANTNTAAKTGAAPKTSAASRSRTQPSSDKKKIDKIVNDIKKNFKT